jgi:hypothetical protein
MQLTAETEPVSALDYPSATPILDVLRPLPGQADVRLSTGDYFFISSAIILGFTELPRLRQFLDSVSNRSVLVFWTAILGLPLLALLAAVAVHLGGHLLAARLTGFDPVRIQFGRFTLMDKLESEDVLSLGFVVMRARRGVRLHSRLAWLVLGGPLSSLLVPLVPETALRLAQNHGARPFLLLPAGIHLFATLSALAGIGALLPDIDSRGNFSDGTRLLMLLKNDFRASRVLAMLKLQLGLKSGESPRSGGEDLVARATAQRDESFDTVAANWLAYLWACRRQDLGAATKFLEAALHSLGSSPGHLRDRISLEAAVFQAWYRHNFVKAKFWESQIASLNALPAWERKRLEIACCWSEGKTFAAWEELGKHIRGVQGLPASLVRASTERELLEWKIQMESRLLAGAWATMHSWPYERQTQRVM